MIPSNSSICILRRRRGSPARVQKKNAQELNTAKFFSILVDETTDVSQQEQMSISVRYAQSKDYVFILREDFLTFVTVENTKGKEYKKNFPETQWKNLTAMCETRWIENHDGLLRFKKIYKAIVDTLDDLSTDIDCETSSKANSFLRSVISSDFVISLSALQNVDLIMKTIEDIRQNIDKKFAKLFQNAQNLLCTVNEEIKILRITSRQEHRANYNTKNPGTYFRMTIMIPLLEDFIDQLQSRFHNHKATLSSLNFLIPSVCCKEQINNKYQEYSFEFYKKYSEWDFVNAKLDMWQVKWLEKSELDRPTCPIEALGECNHSLFPNIQKLFKILATLPVSICTPEGTISFLKRLKTYLRNSTSQERLNGLALMSIHRRIDIDTEKVIDLFAAKKARKLNLIS
ncbi:52 kDa repressor of the inhibitor of the protein kinase-like [Leptinotarsa decemlineata]|uniref:52 kDa repressor of the inhibitor of the protein kinase-like n=1 Tax=Leptinotarsa decemlineata TaxID=7539 RepID=UPI003D3089E6